MKMLNGILVISSLLSLTASTMAFGGTPFPGVKLDAKDVIRIEIGTEEEDVPRANGDKISYLLNDNRKLRSRVRRLEEALRQMQDQIYRMEDLNSRPVVAVAAAPVKEYTCYVKTTFKGTAFGKGSSEAEARAKALQACDEIDPQGFNCEDEKVKCGN